MSKTCTKCLLEKESTDFLAKKRNRDGLDTMCRLCSRKYHKDIYHNKVGRKAQVRKAYRKSCQKRRDYIKAYLAERSCVDCGESDPVVLDFDHVVGEKLYNVSEMPGNNVAWARFIEEISKCEIRCANCHRRVTYQRRVEKLGRVAHRLAAPV